MTDGLYFRLHFEANHNKDYSVVKTLKAAQVAFFFRISGSRFTVGYIRGRGVTGQLI